MAVGAYSSVGADWAGAATGKRRNSALSGEKTDRMKELDVENGSQFNLRTRARISYKGDLRNRVSAGTSPTSSPCPIIEPMQPHADLTRLLDPIVHLSRRMGADVRLVQPGGGNTSVKLDGV